MMDASVIICAHNPRQDYLRRVVDALRSQTLPLDQWELLVVDNASREPLASSLDLSWHPNGRHVAEKELGLTHARNRGACESTTDLLIFVDDDNVLDSAYLAEAVKIAKEWPELGVWGSGMTTPGFESEPADHLKDLIPYLALRTSDAIYWSNVPSCVWATPWGAGLCMRRQVADAYALHTAQTALQISGRTGNILLSGEDKEIAYIACGMGLGMAIFPSLKLLHLIPKTRVSEEYLLRLYEGTMASNYLLRYKWDGLYPQTPKSASGFVDLLANALVRRGVQRRMYFALRRGALTSLEIINRPRAAAGTEAS
jgi:glycosyltransferase involved in cell wall biosynthesis